MTNTLAVDRISLLLNSGKLIFAKIQVKTNVVRSPDNFPSLP
jgi:hypothetical protein